jgi:hypothetical protein
VAGRATLLTPSRPSSRLTSEVALAPRLVSKGNSFAPVSDMLTNQSRDRCRHGPGTCIVRKTEKNSCCWRSSANKNSVRKWCFALMLPLPSRRFTRVKGRSVKYVLRQRGQRQPGAGHRGVADATGTETEPQVRGEVQGLRGNLYVTFEEGAWAGLVLRPGEAARHESCGVQSAEERFAERRTNSGLDSRGGYIVWDD